MQIRDAFQCVNCFPRLGDVYVVFWHSLWWYRIRNSLSPWHEVLTETKTDYWFIASSVMGLLACTSTPQGTGDKIQALKKAANRYWKYIRALFADVIMRLNEWISEEGISIQREKKACLNKVRMPDGQAGRAYFVSVMSGAACRDQHHFSLSSYPQAQLYAPVKPNTHHPTILLYW